MTDCPVCDDLREQLAAATARLPETPSPNAVSARIKRARLAAEKLDMGNQIHAASVRSLVRAYQQSRVNNSLAWRENLALRNALAECEELLTNEVDANLSHLQDGPVQAIEKIDPAPLLRQVRAALKGGGRTDAFNPPPVEELLE